MLTILKRERVARKPGADGHQCERAGIRRRTHVLPLTAYLPQHDPQRRCNEHNGGRGAVMQQVLHRRAAARYVNRHRVRGVQSAVSVAYGKVQPLRPCNYHVWRIEADSACTSRFEAEAGTTGILTCANMGMPRLSCIRHMHV